MYSTILLLWVPVAFSLTFYNAHSNNNSWSTMCRLFILWCCLALFQGFLLSSFWRIALRKNGRGRPGPFYNMNVVGVYPGTQRGPWLKERAGGLFLELLSQALELRMFVKWQMYCSLFKTKNAFVFFDWGPLSAHFCPPRYTTDLVPMIKWTRPVTSIFANCISIQNLDGGKAREWS